MHDSAEQTAITSNSSRNTLRCFLIFVMAAFVSCSALQGPGESGAVLIDTVRGRPADIHEIPVSVDFAVLRQAQANVDMNTPLRVVKIVMSASQAGGESIPQYRLFDIKKGSVADSIGLRNADILVAANGYVVYHPDQFKRYLMSLPILDGTFIEIRREGKAMLLRYTFTGMPDAKGVKASNANIGSPPADEIYVPDSSATPLPELSPTPDNPVNLTKPASEPVVKTKKKATATPTPTSKKNVKNKSKKKTSSSD